MSSLRASKIFNATPDAVKRLGSYTYDSTMVLLANTIVAASNTTGQAGLNGAVLDIDSATWATGNRRAILIASPASDVDNTLALKTQSHAYGQFLDGSVSFSLYCEAPAAFGNAQQYFESLVQFHLQGQMGAPVALYYSANGTQPTIAGLNGATATAAFTSAGLYQPYGLVLTPGGV